MGVKKLSRRNKDCGSYRYVSMKNKRRTPNHYELNKKLHFFDNDEIPTDDWEDGYGINRRAYKMDDCTYLDTLKDRN